MHYFYDDTGVAGFEYNGVDYYFLKNLQGDIIEILNSNGQSVVQYAYDAWGKVISVTGAMKDSVGQYNPFRYRGYYYDTETGLYYLNSRYYDPEVCRFVNADGIIGANGGIQGFNLFAYCNNNPVMYMDAFGTCIHRGYGDCDDCFAAKLSGLEPNNSVKTQINGDQFPTFIDDESGSDPFWASVLVDVGIELGKDLSSFSVKNSARPNNIGIGVYAKTRAKELQIIQNSGTVFGSICDALFVALDVGIGVSNNIESNAGAEKILYDATVDTVFSGGSAALSYYAGAAAGTAFCPVVGTAVGFVVSFALWALIDGTGFRENVKGLID